jgi:ABC-type sugar transport system substrate-binding protein
MARKPRWHRPQSGRSPDGPIGVAVLAVLTCLLGGCDSGSFVPPPPPELQAGERPALRSFTPPPSADLLSPSLGGARSVELVLARHDADDADAHRAAARTQAGLERIKLRITMLGEQDVSAQQAELVREALARKPLALIIEPADPGDKRLAQAVSEAEAAGVPVIFLFRSVAAFDGQPPAPAAKATRIASSAASEPNAPAAEKSAGSAPVSVLAAPDFGPSAKQMVASAMRNVKNAGLDPRSGAIVFINTASDPFILDRAAAIRQALKDAGISAVDEVEFIYRPIPVQKIFAERLRGNPKAVMVFALDSLCLTSVRPLSNQPEFEKHPFVLAGYAMDDSAAPAVAAGQLAAMAEFSIIRMVRKAITTAAAVAAGKEVPPRIDVPIVVHDSPPNAGLPPSHAVHTEGIRKQSG